MKPAAFGLLHVIPKHLRQEDMERTIRAKFKNGVIEPLEKLELEEGRFEKAMGSWKGRIDCEQLIKDIYESRRLSAFIKISSL